MMEQVFGYRLQEQIYECGEGKGGWILREWKAYKHRKDLSYVSDML